MRYDLFSSLTLTFVGFHIICGCVQRYYSDYDYVVNAADNTHDLKI